jgi:hypothetical protein
VEYELSARQGDGASLRTHLQRRAKNTGDVDPRLQMRWPRWGEPLWRAFTSMGRQYGMAGPLPLSQCEIQAWQSNNSVRLTPWELDMVREFDVIALEAAAKDQKQ